MKRGSVGVDQLNHSLQQRLNPAAANKPELMRAGVAYRLGDKVMQIRNNYDKGVFNGDIGRWWR
jgi:exodeoxyribonuclease V alpha subunit